MTIERCAKMLEKRTAERDAARVQVRAVETLLNTWEQDEPDSLFVQTCVARFRKALAVK